MPLNNAQTILKLIEEVDPSDTYKLNEIDARVWCWLRCDTYHSSGGTVVRVSYLNKFDEVHTFIKYTRSRDALKAIRPQGWEYQTYQKGKEWFAELETEDVSCHVFLLTEELAELHTILQAIEWERTKNATIHTTN